MTDPLGNKTTYLTDTVGRTTSVTTPLRETTSYLYNALSEVTTQTDGNGHQTSYQYDLLGEVTQSTVANQHESTITRQATLDSTTTCDPANNCTTDNKDVMGRRSKFTDKRGVVDTYSYLKYGRVFQVVFNSNGINGIDKRTLSYTYDSFDRLSAVTDSAYDPNSPELTYTYDGMDHILTEVTPESTVTYDYDANGRRKSMQAGTQAQVNYTYWNDDQLNTISNPNVTGTVAYDGDGRRQSLTTSGVAPNGVLTQYGYDAASEVTSETYIANNVSLGNLTYSYDPDGHVVGEGGSFARLSIPPTLSASYTNTDQIATFNKRNCELRPRQQPDSRPGLIGDLFVGLAQPAFGGTRSGIIPGYHCWAEFWCIFATRSTRLKDS